MKKILFCLLALFMITGCDLFNRSEKDSTPSTGTSGSQTSQTGTSQSGNNPGSTTTNPTVDYKTYVKAGGEYATTIEKTITLTNGTHKIAYVYSKDYCKNDSEGCATAYVTILMDNNVIARDVLAYATDYSGVEAKKYLDEAFSKKEEGFPKDSDFTFLPNSNGTFVLKFTSAGPFSETTYIYVISNNGQVLLRDEVDTGFSLETTINGVYTTLMPSHYVIKDNTICLLKRVDKTNCSITGLSVEAYSVSTTGAITHNSYKPSDYFGVDANKIKVSGGC